MDGFQKLQLSKMQLAYNTQRLIYLIREVRSWQKEYFKLVKLVGKKHSDTLMAFRSARHFEDQLDQHLETAFPKKTKNENTIDL